MADFCNGSIFTNAESEYCDRCVHEEDDQGHGCPVMGLHLWWEDDAVGDNTKRHVLDTLWPMKTTPRGTFPDKCAMFHEKPQEPERPLFPEMNT